MKYKYLLLLLLLFFLNCVNNTQSTSKQAINGVINLSDWDFQKQGFVSMEGQWEFFWNQFLYPNEPIDNHFENRTAYLAPGDVWSDQEKKEEQGAGDQGMMFGYATNETEHYMPLALDLAHNLLIELAAIRREKNSKMPYLRPDAKSQVTLEYDDNNQPVRIDAIVISTQHDDFDSETKMLAKIKNDVITILIPRIKARYKKYAKLFNSDIKYHINPTGKFVIGGPHGDTGLTGRKIIVDTYGGKGAHGGGAFSGKDPSKVDRSAAYATRHIAKNLVAAGLASEVLVQVSYAIGVAQPTSINVNTYGTSKVQMTDGEISKVVERIFDMRPYFIEQRFKLRNPIYSETAAYGHMGRKSEVVEKTFTSPDGKKVTKKVELFTWEKLDYVSKVKKAFGLK